MEKILETSNHLNTESAYQLLPILHEKILIFKQAHILLINTWRFLLDFQFMSLS